MPHYTPARTAKAFKAHKFGKTFESDEDACKAAKYDELTFGVLSEAMGALEAVSELVAKIAGKRLAAAAKATYHIRKFDIEQQIVAREDKHGECPEELRDHLTKKAIDNLNDHFSFAFRHLDCEPPRYFSIYIKPPEKNHPLRKEYDRWMKRKAPKTKSGIDE